MKKTKKVKVIRFRKDWHPRKKGELLDPETYAYRDCTPPPDGIWSFEDRIYQHINAPRNFLINLFALLVDEGILKLRFRNLNAESKS